jgi:hypothetical protein
MGIAVFSGMVGVTLFGIFLTPVFYVLLRKWTERGRERAMQLRTAMDASAHPKAPGVDATVTAKEGEQR